MQDPAGEDVTLILSDIVRQFENKGALPLPDLSSSVLGDPREDFF